MPIVAKILLVEDDPVMSLMLSQFFQKNNYEITVCTNGKTAWANFMRYKFDICLLDIMLPGKLDGVELAKRIRQKSKHVPLMLLSSKNADEIADNFQHGIDGYLVKPYNLHELLCRMNVFLRRNMENSTSQQSHFQLGHLVFDFDAMQLKNSHIAFELTQREAELLRYLCINANNIVRKEQILADLWGKNDQYLERSLGVFIARLRKYVKSEPSVSIQTIPRVGFKFVIPATGIVSKIALPQMYP